jgi:spore germination protein GerM
MQDESLRNQNPPEPPAEKRSFLTQMPARMLLALAAVLLATGSATAWWTWQTITTNRVAPTPAEDEMVVTPIEPVPVPDTPTTTTPQEPVAQSPTPVPNATETVAQVFWLQDTGTNLELVPTEIRMEPDMSDSETLAAAFEQLMQGPAATEMASSIPAETELNAVEIREDGVHVDLSDEFELGGGSASMMGRLGQVIYTATTLDPDANVWISIDGDPLKLLGGEGLIVDQPMTRADFEAAYPL